MAGKRASARDWRIPGSVASKRSARWAANAYHTGHWARLAPLTGGIPKMETPRHGGIHDTTVSRAGGRATISQLTLVRCCMRESYYALTKPLKWL